MSNEEQIPNYSGIKQLKRSKNNRMLAGVCGGIAEYIGFDAVLIRILWVLLSIFGGVGLLLYLAAYFIVPEESEEQATTNLTRDTGKDKTLFWGGLFIAVGIILMLKQFGVFHYFRFWALPWQGMWAFALILVGAYLIFRKEPLQFMNSKSGQTTQSGQTADHEQIYRSSTNKMLAGVCGGLAEHFNLDPAIIRLGFVLVALASFGMGVIAYIIMLVVFPEKPAENIVNSETTSIERK